jgi:CheY-like chemotaxis protein
MAAENKPVLVVDDEEIVRESVSDWLKSEGYDVDSAEDGLRALDKVKKKDYEVVVLDMKMPGMDGLTVLKQLHETNPGIKVIIITAYASVETAVQALKDGAVDYIVKPFEPEQLEKSVAKWVGKPKIVSGSAPTETSAESSAEEGSREALPSVLEETRNLLNSGNLDDALALLNKALSAAPAKVKETGPPRTVPKAKPREAVEEEKAVAPPKAKPGTYFPPHFWEGCFIYTCGKNTCPFTAECFAAQGRHQRETEKFIEKINQILLEGGKPNEEQQAELDHAKEHHGVQFDAKQGIYFISKTALKHRPGIGGSYFR